MFYSMTLTVQVSGHNKNFKIDVPRNSLVGVIHLEFQFPARKFN